MIGIVQFCIDTSMDQLLMLKAGRLQYSFGIFKFQISKPKIL